MSDDKPIAIDDMMIGTMIAINHIIRVLEDAGVTDRKETLRFLRFATSGEGHPPNAFLGLLLGNMESGRGPELHVIEGGRDEG